MISQIFLGFRDYFDVLSNLRKYNLLLYFLLAGILGVVLFFVMGLFAVPVSGFIRDGFGDLVLRFSWLPDWMNVGDSGWLGQISKWAMRLVSFLLGLLFFKHIFLIVSGPIMSLVSARVEKVDRQKSRVQEVPFMKGIIRGSKIAGRNVVLELLITLGISILGLILGPLAVVTPFLILAVQAYYAGVGNLDFTLERYKNVSDTISYARRHKGYCIANGLFYVLALTTVVGIFFIPVLSAAAGAKQVLRDHR